MNPAQMVSSPRCYLRAGALGTFEHGEGKQKAHFKHREGSEEPSALRSNLQSSLDDLPLHICIIISSWKRNGQ